MTMITRRDFFLASAAAAFSAAAQAQAPTAAAVPVEGRDYVRLNTPVPVPAGPAGPSHGVVAQPVLVARDMVTAYIDADNSNRTGFAVNGTTLGAEYALVVTGASGRVLGIAGPYPGRHL